MTKKSYLTLLEVYAGIARGFWGCFGVRSPSRGPTERQSLKVPWDLLQSQKFCGKAHVRKGGALVTTQKALCRYIKYLHWEWSFFSLLPNCVLRQNIIFFLTKNTESKCKKIIFLPRWLYAIEFRVSFAVNLWCLTHDQASRRRFWR